MGDIIRVVELYSGIGGMHYACQLSGISYEVVAAVDINTTANTVYLYNFPGTTLLQRNIQSITSQQLDKLRPDMLTMSPPCQPFTRQGLQLDTQDPRTNSFSSLLKAITDMEKKPRYILLENVKGFETSEMCEKFLRMLRRTGYHYRQCLLCPRQFGIQNARLRYYCLAKHIGTCQSETTRDTIITKPQDLNFNLPEITSPHSISRYLIGNYEDVNKILESTENTSHDDPNVTTLIESDTSMDTSAVDNGVSCIEEEENRDKYLIPEKVLFKFANILDIVTPDSQSSCCFTKGYTHYTEGTGSVLLDQFSKEVLDDAYAHPEESTRQQLIKALRLRYFAPREVANLMGFPKEFTFPQDVKDRHRYQLLGNSVNVSVISKLIDYLDNHFES